MSSNSTGASTNLSRVITAGESGTTLWLAVFAYLKLWARRFMKSESRLRRHIDSKDLVAGAFIRLIKKCLRVKQEEPRWDTPSECKRDLKSKLCFEKRGAVRRYLTRQGPQIDDADGQFANLAADDSGSRRAVREAIALCMSELPEGERRLLTQRFVENKSVAALEIEFGCSRRTLNRRLVQAKASFWEVAKQHGLVMEN